MKRLLFLIALISSINVGCKKDNNLSSWDQSSEAYLKDSTLYYTKLFSLWQNNIEPRNINDILDSNKVRAITKKFNTSEELLNFLTAQTPKGSNNEPIDRYSFIDRQGAISDEIQNAQLRGYGLSFIYLIPNVPNANNANLHVRMVDVNSNAELAGLKRGDRIISINGITQLDYNTQRAEGFADINRALASSPMIIRWQNSNNEIIEKTISASNYTFNPINNQQIFDVDNKKVGYISFTSFVSIRDRNNIPNTLYQEFQNIFSQFEQQQVNDLIIDLRYNGGGDVETAEYLANKIVPTSATGKLMYYYKLNALLTQELGQIFAPVNFNKLGNLNLSKVYFLVTSNTASASEILINSLRPYMDVQIIGSENTYGKPVGFWETPIEHKNAKLSLYITSFQTFNANNFGDYFDGLTPNKIANESFTKQIGDETEGLIAEALYHVKNGSYSISTRSNISPKEPYRMSNLPHSVIESSHLSNKGMFKFGHKDIKLK